MFKKHGVQIEQTQGQFVTEIKLVGIEAQKLKVEMIKLVRKYFELNVPEDWQDVFGQIDQKTKCELHDLDQIKFSAKW